MMEEEMGSLKEKVSDFSAAHKVHEERCINDDITTTNKLNAMNERVMCMSEYILKISFLSLVITNIAGFGNTSACWS